MTGDRLNDIERTLRHAQGTGSTKTDSWLNGYQDDVAFLVARVRDLEAVRLAALDAVAEAIGGTSENLYLAHRILANSTPDGQPAVLAGETAGEPT